MLGVVGLQPTGLTRGGNRNQGLGGGFEQQVIDDWLVLIGDIADWRGQCENHVEIWHGQQLRRPRLHPLTRRRALALRTVPVAAAVVGDGRVATGIVLAAHDMPAEGRRAAALDRAHHLELAEAQVTAVGLTPSGPVVAEDIRDLQAHAGPALCRRPLGWQRQPIEGLSTVRSTLVATWYSGLSCP